MVRRRVLGVRLVHVPDAVIPSVRPDGSRRNCWKITCRGRAIIGADLCCRPGERGNGNPDERLAGRGIPRVDFVVEVIARRISEAKLVRRRRKVIEIKPRHIRETDKDGEIRERRCAGIAAHREMNLLGKERRVKHVCPRDRHKRKDEKERQEIIKRIAPPPRNSCNYISHDLSSFD